MRSCIVTFTAVAALTLLTAPPTSAAPQTPGANATRSHLSGSVPHDHWAYDTLDRLLHPGRIVIGHDEPSDRPAMTRDAFAAATAQLLERHGLLRQPTPSATLTLDSESALLLRTLVVEFAPELGKRGIDATAWKDRLGLLSAQRSRDLPSAHWSYSAINSLFKSGLIPGYPNGTAREKRALTRFEFAVATARALHAFPLTSALPQPVDRENLELLRRLTEEFSPELDVLGLRTAPYLARLRTLLRVVPPFADVAEGHWASPSVETVRRDGLMIGFPDGRFYGNR